MDFIIEQTFQNSNEAEVSAVVALVDEQTANASTARTVKLTHLARQLSAGAPNIHPVGANEARKKRRISIQTLGIMR